ncbi:DUF732 domain-containing protein [Mycobacterium seoulense]|uniref:DUF732 domain-containing protein n=1 Tax=Mycobacterium seoulense TaxID=386911 RepID=UPI003CE995AF
MTYNPYYPPQRPTYPQVYRPPLPPPPRRRSSKGAWILVAVLAVVAVIGLVIFGAVLSQSRGSNPVASTSPTSSSNPTTSSKFTCPDTRVPPNPRTDPDCYFVFMMTLHAGLPSSHGVPSGLIADAHAVCRAMDQALATGQDTAVAGVQWVQRKHPDLSMSDAAFVAGISEVAYCPWDNTHPVPH